MGEMAHRRSSKVLLKHCSHPEDWLAVVQLFCPIQIAEVDLSILWHFKTSFGSQKLSIAATAGISRVHPILALAMALAPLCELCLLVLGLLGCWF